VSGDELMSKIVPDSAVVFRFDLEYQLSEEMVATFKIHLVCLLINNQEKIKQCKDNTEDVMIDSKDTKWSVQKLLIYMCATINYC